MSKRGIIKAASNRKHGNGRKNRVGPMRGAIRSRRRPMTSRELATVLDCDTRTVLHLLTINPHHFRRANPDVTPKKGAPALYELVPERDRASVPICRHCTKSKVNRPRGLCWGCYYTPGVKELYPSTSKYARRGLVTPSGLAPLPAEPTTAAPGTPEKVAVMEARAKAGESLWHPLDAKGDAESSEFASPGWQVPIYHARLGNNRLKGIYEDNCNRESA